MPERKKLEKLLKEDPDDVFLNFGLAMELAKRGLAEEALARFDRVLELDPAYLAAYSQKSAVLIAEGRRDEARVVLEAGVKAARAANDAHIAAEMQKTLDTLG